MNFFKNSFRTTIKVSNRLDPDQNRRTVRPALGPNCLQRLSKEDKSSRLNILFTKSRGYSNIINHSIYQTNVINLKQLILISQVI